MIILIQDKVTERYAVADRRFTADPAEARRFSGTREAFNFILNDLAQGKLSHFTQACANVWIVLDGKQHHARP